MANQLNAYHTVTTDFLVTEQRASGRSLQRERERERLHAQASYTNRQHTQMPEEIKQMPLHEHDQTYYTADHQIWLALNLASACELDSSIIITLRPSQTQTQSSSEFTPSPTRSDCQRYIQVHVSSSLRRRVIGQTAQRRGRRTMTSLKT
jgi:hypothetical protein